MSWVLFFDGECVFCNRTARWIGRVDKCEILSFASLQGTLAHVHGLNAYAHHEQGGVVLLREEDGRMWTHADAVLKVMTLMSMPWPCLAWGALLLKPVSHMVYRVVARHRHRLVRRDVCDIPDDSFRRRLRD